MEQNKEKIEGQENQKETKTYTEEEVQKLLQSETDKRVTQALKTAQEKWQKEYEAKLEQERSEAEKLAKMTEQERLLAEFEKQKKAFEEEKKQFLKAQLEMQTVKELSALGLPTDFSKFVMADNAETIKTNIDTFKTYWEQAIEKAVNEKLQGTTPKVSTKTGGSITKEQFKKMTIAEKTALFNEDPDLYYSLRD
ncbi:DUF4355 domain-containing protein [Neobacillus sedimentimangrovi]|uniref:DUF4355 domain-containing protein n=1 Tax=Neobacillus sedimentimangrovi TaxID=2699460 RepID=A0ABS8QKH9_9BACI|nr:DUF4355 domain-containing protein [Neobacillus sedimentimangrovi]MCD4839737.1 DUF4355 domain-containing protein [Neobacillus sedimentimangrovi]